MNSLKESGKDDFEEALRLLYEDEDDELAFDAIIDAIGGAFDVLGFIFFLKDPERYLPIRSSLFDDRFKLLGFDSALAGNCTWDKYQQYIAWIKEVQDYLVANVNKEISLLDAHSFIWVLPGIADYEMMRNIRKGDFILHNSNGKIMSISVAQSDCYEADQPHELQTASTTVDWDIEGYRIDTKYYDFDAPLLTTDHTEWLADHYIEGSAFTNQGRGKQQYMCGLAEEHAIYLIEKAIELQTSNEVLNNLKAALEEIIGDKNSEYDQAEMESIEQLVGDSNDEEKPEWSGEKHEQAMTTSSATGRAIPKRDPQRAADALQHADYLCEYDNSDRTFLRKNGKPYTEPHHLIPISKYRDFDYSVDVMENIVSLCSHCHNLLHYGRFEDKKPILEKLYDDRKDALEECGLELTLEELEGYYK